MGLRWSCEGAAKALRWMSQGVIRSIAAEQARLNFCHLATATRLEFLPKWGKRSAFHAQENNLGAIRMQGRRAKRTAKFDRGTHL
jgi:hypothetical protein